MCEFEFRQIGALERIAKAAERMADAMERGNEKGHQVWASVVAPAPLEITGSVNRD